jgi:AI2M/AI1M-like HNH endonuclease
VGHIVAQYKKTLQLPHGPRRCIVATVNREGKKPLIAYFGGIPLKRKPPAVVRDVPDHNGKPTRSELVARLLAEECEVCGTAGNVTVHHVRALKDLQVKGRKEKPLWMRLMAARRRKTLIVCADCHADIQHGKPLRKATVRA